MRPPNAKRAEGVDRGALRNASQTSRPGTSEDSTLDIEIEDWRQRIIADADRFLQRKAARRQRGRRR